MPFFGGSSSQVEAQIDQLQQQVDQLGTASGSGVHIGSDEPDPTATPIWVKTP